MRRTVPVFSRRDGYTAPLQTVCGVCGGGCGFGGLHARQRDAVPPLHRGAGLLHICHSLFCPPCPAPDSRFPLADFYLRQLPAFKLSCVNCNPSRAILCGTYLIIKGGAALCKFATGLFEAAVNCCNFAQGIARILCRTFPEHVGKTHRIALFPYAAYRWKTAQVAPGTVVILHRVFPLPCPAVTRVPVGKPHRIGPFPGVAIYTGLAVFGLFATLHRLLSAQESSGGMHRLVLVEHTGLRCYITQALPITNIELNI